MDKLEDLFKRQKELQKHFGNNLDKMSEYMRQQYTKDNVLGLLDEVHEILREINWKKWKRSKKKIDKDRLKTEWVDALHFLINIALVWNIDAVEAYDSYLKKDEIIYKRIKEGY